MPPAWGVAATVGDADCATLGALGWLREAMWALTCLITSGAALMTSGATAVTMGTAATHPHMNGATRRTRGRASFIAPLLSSCPAWVKAAVGIFASAALQVSAATPERLVK